MSGFYIGVDGKARKVKGAYIGIDGVARKIKKGYIGVDGVERLCWSAFDGDPVFANNSWEKIIEACQTGNVPDTWTIGDQKTMSIGGTNYTIDIIGKNHDDYADGSGKAPLTFQLHTCYSSMYGMNNNNTNANGWNSCNVRTTHMVDLLGKLPTEVQSAVREVNKLTSSGYQSKDIIISTDKLFLLSEIEVFGKTTNSVSGEGIQYEYYTLTGNYIKQINGSNMTYWLRSPAKNANTAFCRVTGSGTSEYISSSTYSHVVPAFCF